MSTTMIVTRNVSDRTRGFLASSLLEVAPGVYFGARVSVAVRERVWGVLAQTWHAEVDASVIMVWREPKEPSEHAVRTLGLPPVDLVEVDGLVLARRTPTTRSRGEAAARRRG
jgi:CRISPR-associated protein Cas2